VPETRPQGTHTDGAPEFDRELDTRAVWTFAGGLLAVMVVVGALMWGMLVVFKARAKEQDPAPSPIAEANQERLPPEPRLQDDPTLDMTRLRAGEDAILETYGWVDRGAGIGRLPIDRAIELIAATGLPPTPAIEVEPAPAGRGHGAPIAPGAKTRSPRRPRRTP